MTGGGFSTCCRSFTRKKKGEDEKDYNKVNRKVSAAESGDKPGFNSMDGDL